VQHSHPQKVRVKKYRPRVLIDVDGIVVRGGVLARIGQVTTAVDGAPYGDERSDDRQARGSQLRCRALRRRIRQVRLRLPLTAVR
jgi:hypothetical protein